MAARRKTVRKKSAGRSAPRVALVLKALRGIAERPPKGFRAVCTRGDFRGTLRGTRGEAAQDALDHQDDNMSHRVEVLIEH